MGRPLAALVVAAAIVACGSDSGSTDDGVVVASVDFDIAPAEVALGDVGCGAAASSAITIRNKGGATLAYRIELADGSSFVLKANASGTLGPDATATIPIELRPGSAGDIGELATIDVNGIVQQIPLRARAVGATLVAEPALVDFGEVRFDRTFTREIIIRNTGNAPAAVDAFEGATDSMFVGPTGLTLEPNAQAIFTATIGAGAVTGAPTKASITPTLAAGSAHCGPRPSVNVTALRVAVEVTLSPADFGRLDCGTGAGTTRDIEIRNYALQQLTYTATLAAGSVFTIASGGSGTLPAATQTTSTTAIVKIAMRETATVLGPREEDVTIQIDPLPAASGGGTRTTKARRDIRGAIITAMPGQLSLEGNDKSPASAKIRFQNNGNESIKLRYEIDEKDDTDAFSLDTSNQIIPANNGLDLGIGFRPSSRGGIDTYSATLKVARDSGGAVCSPLPQPKLEGTRKR